MNLQTRENLIDRLEKYYNDEVQLSVEEQQICERIELAFALLKKHKSKAVAVKKYLKHFENLNQQMHPTTAYLDFKKAEKIFVPIHKVSKEMHRIIMIESIDKQINFLRIKQKGTEEKPISDRDYLQIQDRINKLIELRIKASGIDKDDPNIPDFSKIQPPILQMNIPPAMESALKKILKSGVIDVSNFMEELNPSEDVSFDEDFDDE